MYLQIDINFLQLIPFIFAKTSFNFCRLIANKTISELLTKSTLFKVVLTPRDETLSSESLFISLTQIWSDDKILPLIAPFIIAVDIKPQPITPNLKFFFIFHLFMLILID